MISSPIFIYYGNDVLLLEEKVNQHIQTLLQQNSSLKIFDSSVTTEDQLLSLLEEDNLFGQSYLIKVRKGKESFHLSQIEQTSHSHQIFFIVPEASLGNLASEVKKNPKRYLLNEFNLPKPWEIEKLIHQHLGNRVAPELLMPIASSLKSVLEIEEMKLLLDRLNINQITLKNYQLILEKKEIGVIILCDSFFSNHPILFLTLLNNYLEASEPIEPLISFLHKKIVDFIVLKRLSLQHLENSEIAKQMGLSEFIVKKNKVTIQPWSLSLLENLLIKLGQGEFFMRKYAGMFNQYFLEKLFLTRHFF